MVEQSVIVVSDWPDKIIKERERDIICDCSEINILRK